MTNLQNPTAVPMYAETSRFKNIHMALLYIRTGIGNTNNSLITKDYTHP
jgi:hypothetical protein